MKWRTVKDYTIDLKHYLHDNGIVEFKHEQLPGLYKSQNGGLLRKAHNRGYVARVGTEKGSLLAIWKVII